LTDQNHVPGTVTGIFLLLMRQIMQEQLPDIDFFD